MSQKAKTLLIILPCLIAATAIVLWLTLWLDLSLSFFLPTSCVLLLAVAAVGALLLRDLDLSFKPQQKTKKALSIISICAFVVFAAIVLLWAISDHSGWDALVKAKNSKISNITALIVFGLMTVLLVLVAVGTAFINNERISRNDVSKAKYFTSQNITRLSIFTALSFVLYMFAKFNLPFFPSFLDIQISELPALIAGFMMGPLAGCLVTLFKVLLKLPFSSTMYVGELADLVIGCAFVLPSSIIYRKLHTKKGAILGLLAGYLTSTLMAVAANYFILVPFYVEVMFKGSWAPLCGMLSELYQTEVTQSNFFSYYLPLAVLPLNLLRGALSALVTFLVYKQLGVLFKKFVPKAKAAPIEAVTEVVTE